MNVQWELFSDECNYGLWVVKPVDDNDFNSPRSFGFMEKKDAEAFKVLVEKAYISIPEK